MTYNELKALLETLTEEQLHQEVYILLADSNEFLPVTGYGINDKEGLDRWDELEENALYLMIED